MPSTSGEPFKFSTRHFDPLGWGSPALPSDFHSILSAPFLRRKNCANRALLDKGLHHNIWDCSTCQQALAKLVWGPGWEFFLEKGYKCKWKSIWPLEGPPDQLSLPIPGAGIPSSFLPPAQACLQEVTSSPCFSVAVPGMWCKPSRLSKDLDLFSLRVARMSILGHWKPPTSYLRDSWFCKVCHIALSRAAYSSSPYNMGCF